MSDLYTAVLHFKDAARGHESGLAGLVRHTGKQFSDHYLDVAKHYVKLGQAAFHVGRLPTMESSVFTLTRGELPL